MVDSDAMLTMELIFRSTFNPNTDTEYRIGHRIDRFAEFRLQI